MAHHEIPATPEMMVWGTLDAARPPVLTVDSGDTVTLRSFPAGGKSALPADAARVMICDDSVVIRAATAETRIALR